MRLNKRVIRATVAALCLVLVTQAAQAWIIPALAATGRFLAGPITNTVMWLGRSAAANPTMAKAVEWSIAAHGAVIGATLINLGIYGFNMHIEALIGIANSIEK